MSSIALRRHGSRVAAVAKAVDAPLNCSELGRFREVLLQKHAELLQDAARMSNDPWEMEVSSHLYQHARGMLAEVEDALKRIDSGTYGFCEGAEHPIGLARLRAIPWARRCFECAGKWDRSR